MDLNAARLAVKDTVKAYAKEIIDIGEHVWKNPEPGYREVKTSAFLAGKLEELGLTVKKGLAVTGFRADIDTGLYRMRFP